MISFEDPEEGTVRRAAKDDAVTKTGKRSRKRKDSARRAPVGSRVVKSEIVNEGTSGKERCNAVEGSYSAYVLG